MPWLEATSLANGYQPEEVVMAAIEDFLQKANQLIDYYWMGG
jgi:hypothetical protein